MLELKLYTGATGARLVALLNRIFKLIRSKQGWCNPFTSLLGQKRSNQLPLGNKF